MNARLVHLPIGPLLGSRRFREYCRCPFDATTYARIGAAATDITAHCLINVFVIRRLVLIQERHSGHYLAGLTVAALRHLLVDPCLLYRVQAGFITADALDRGDSLIRRSRYRCYARANRRAVEMNCTGAALRDAATKFCASQSRLFPDYPKKRCGRIYIDVVALAIDRECNHDAPLFGFAMSRELSRPHYSMGFGSARLAAAWWPARKSHRKRAKMCRSRSARTGQLQKKISRNLRGTAAISAVTVNTVVWFFPVMLVAIFKLLVPCKSFRRIMARWIMAMGENWVSWNAVILSLRHSDRIDVRGIEGLNRHDWYLVIANHQTWVDIIALQVVLNRRIPFLKFFIKQEMMWFPFLGLVWWAMDMPFMKRYSKSYLAKHPEKKGQDLEATRGACRKFRDTPTSVINFIEGTRFTMEKKIRRNSQFEYLLPPRAGGIALALTSMGGMFNAILDITLVYPQGVAHFWDLCCGDVDDVIIEINKRPVERWMVEGDYENDREFRSRFHRWLTQVWQEKDGQIGSLLSESAAS